MKGIPAVLGPLGDNEWKAWQELCDEFCKATGMTRDQMNDAKYRPFFRAIERWGIQYLRLRYAQIQTKDWDINDERTLL